MSATMDSNPEAETFKLLSDLQTALAAALNSLSGKLPKTICDGYYLNAGAYVNRAAEGYLLLRKAGRADASKLLVRPAIEAMIRIQALRRRPDLLYRIAYSEALEDKKWFRPAAVALGKTFDEKADPPGWNDFEKAFKEAFPNTPAKREKLSLFAAAEIAGLDNYYNRYYRMYCKYAHAALRAIGGYLDEMSDSEDTRTMIWSTFAALDGVSMIGADSPELQRLRVRVDDLSKQPQIQFGREVID